MISQLTFTRFIAAFLIVFLHYGSGLFPQTPDFLQILRENFHLGVSYFFVLSGYVMMIAYSNLESINFKTYLTNRLSRIYPTHLLALFLTILVSILSSLNYLEYYKFDMQGFILNIFLMQAWFPGNALSLNIPSWSISVELFFYICFPFLFNYLIKRTKPKTVIFSFMAFWLISQVCLNLYYNSSLFDPKNVLDKNFLFYNPFFNSSSFVIGCLAGYIFRSKIFQNRNYDFIIIFLTVLTAAFVIIFQHLLLQNGLLSINFALIIFILSINNGKITQAFKNKKLVHLGDISFAMYLLQFPIFMALKKVNSVLTIKNPYIYFLIGFLILIVISHFVYIYFENPLRKKLKHILHDCR